MTAQIDKKWDGLTITRDLAVGIYFAGIRHTRFTLRAPVAGDLIGAHEQYPGAPWHLTTIDVYRRQLLSVGDIPAENLTTELLRDSLMEIDLAVIADADLELEKKLKPQSAATPTGDESNTPSSGTATE
ncbi:hypothetical protein N8A88_22300 [Pseudomonas shahriarae]|uniref:hypothetical protein n=1 Tax=Pseudomonas shahriarae TaxID=2745512 RepID=UPI0021C8BF87|nr:hypothetical protein [Pseudomonas shahriarae]MCU0213324.1 hypothetical protein [Pseudomonas shahriarae]